jgi:hypothetical protein
MRSLEIDPVEGVVLAKLEWMTEECEEGGRRVVVISTNASRR